MLVAAGDVIAGVDLATLRPEDVQVDADAGTVRVRLPADEILASRLDNDGRFVCERSSDTLARRSETLETRARQEAECTLTLASIDAGVLLRAEAGARQSITALPRPLGFENAVVRSLTDERLPALTTLLPRRDTLRPNGLNSRHHTENHDLPMGS